MKRICAALLLVVFLSATALASSSALDALTSQNIVTKLTTAIAPCKSWKPSLTREDDAGNMREMTFSLSPSVTVVASIEKGSDRVTQLLFLAVPNPRLSAEARARALVEDMANSVESATRLVLPQFEQIKGLKDALYESVGPLNKKIYNDVDKKHTMRLNGIGVVLSAMFTGKGIYVLHMGSE